jgi:hypothetical protein
MGILEQALVTAQVEMERVLVTAQEVGLAVVRARVLAEVRAQGLEVDRGLAAGSELGMKLRWA